MSFYFAEYAPGARAEFSYDLTDKLWEDLAAAAADSTLEPGAIAGIRDAVTRWEDAGPTESLNYDEWFLEVYPEW